MRSFLRLNKEHKTEKAGNSNNNNGKVEWKYGLFDAVHDDGEEAIVDIYFVHGLNGDRFESFSYVQADGTTCFWPKDLLPERLHAAGIKFRIFCYGYNANTHTGRISLQSLWDHGEEFLKTIAEERHIEGKQERPIIFMAYSLGGLVVKSALNLSYISSIYDDPISHTVFLSTHAVFFFGVPHQGGNTSAISLGKVVLNIVGAARNTTKKVVEILDPGNQTLEAHFNTYNKISHNFNQRSFWEKYETPVKLLNMEVKNLLVVPKESAVIPGMKNDQAIVLSKDHHDLLRFQSANDPDFKAVARGLIIELGKSMKPINDRWAEWNKQLRQQKTPSLRIRPNFPFPRNPRFKGRQNEISQLQENLTKHDEAQYAVICGPGGIGKTSLALEYCHVNQSAHNYIIWVHARTTRAAEDGYIWFLEEIIHAKTEDAPQRKPDFQTISRDLGIQGMLKGDGTLNVGEDQKNRTRAVASVRSWLEMQYDHSWLIVFDEVDDVEVPIKDFIPRCNWGSHMLTTRRPDVRDYANCGFDLGGLSNVDGKALLLHGTKFDLLNGEVNRKSGDIVSMMESHPLAIDQASAYLRQRPFITLDDYIQAYKNKLKETRPRELLIRNENIWHDYNLTCMTTFEVSRDAIHAETSDAPKVLQLCCWLDRDDIWIPFLKAHKQSIGADLTDDHIDKCIALLYSYSLVQPKLAAHAFSIHAVVHFWGRERLEIKDRMDTMLEAFYSLVHSPYYSTGSGEIYQVSPEDFKLQRSAVHHLEYALEVGDEAIGYWNLRYSGEILSLSDQNMRTSIFRVVDEVFSGLGGFGDFPKPPERFIRPSTVRPFKITVDHKEFLTKFEEALDILKKIWTLIASVPSILFEQGKLHLSLRWQLRVLSYILTYSPAGFNVIMAPDRFREQVPISLMAIALNLQTIGELHAAERIIVYLREDYAGHHQIKSNLQLQAKLVHDKISRQLYRQTASIHSEELTIDSIMDALTFKRERKTADDRPEQMNLVLESAETLAQTLFDKEDFAAVDIFRKIREKRDEALPNGEVDYFLSCLNLGNALRLKGAVGGNKEDLSEAKVLLEQSLEGLTRLLGDGDYRKVRCLVALGSTCNYRGELVMAEKHLSLAMIHYKDVSDATPYDKIACQEKLADARVGLKKYSMAENGFFHCWSQTIRRLSFDNAESLQALISWATSLYLFGDKVPAFLLLICALERKQACEQFDRSTQRAIGYILHVIGDFEKEPNGRRSTAMRDRYIKDFILSVQTKGLPADLTQR